MALCLYNTLGRRKEPFKPMGSVVGYYTCGPTVYDYAHIGNFRAYVFQDMLKRYLLYKGFKVKHIMNITDVDDKTIKGSVKKGVSLIEYTRLYEQAFFEDLKKLNILPADVYPRATEHIPEMVAMIKGLLAKGTAYRGQDGSVYFSIGRFRDYGKFAGISREGMLAGARVSHDTYTKDNVSDFALWKSWDKEDGDVFWQTELGKGRPGWHIECSAMSMKYLGESFDVHAGGIDLVFPHHQNEIAQSEGCTGRQFVRYWIHNNHLIVEGQKMSKSLKNFYTLRDLEGHDPMAVRYALLATHYRAKLDFSKHAISAASANVAKMKEFIRNLRAVLPAQSTGDVSALMNGAGQGFEKAMDDDLNIAKALSVVFDFIAKMNVLIAQGCIGSKDAGAAIKLMEAFDSVLGLNIASVQEWKSASNAPDWLKKLIEDRERFRQKKDYSKADGIRKLIESNGIIIEDKGSGVRWRNV